MDRRSITVIIDDAGQTTVEAHGYTGGSCVKATAPLTKALIGGAADKSIKKSEYNQQEVSPRLRELQ